MSEREAVVTSDKQNGGKFSEEMKDYAKSTMNELLGMFGYEEEITREAVEELQIRLLPEDDENLQQMTAKPLEIEKDDAVAVDVNAGQNPVVVQIPGLENDSSAAVIPLPEFDNAVSHVPVEVPSLPQDSVNTSSETIKPDPALAPHFLAEPPNIKGVYCVVANLPVVNSGNKTNMTFKFWNCIMCSDYFVQKPEVVFRVEHPHLFGSHPAWLFQAAVCQKCHQSLTTSKQGTPSNATPKEMSSQVVDSVNGGHQQTQTSSPAQVMNTRDVPYASDNTTVTVSSSVPSNHVFSKSARDLVSQSVTKIESQEFNNAAKVLFDCYVCSKPVYNDSQQGKLRRSKFPLLFSNLPKSVGIQKVCFLCWERLTRQRDIFVRAGISEDNRDYLAHIKIWTGQDFSRKMVSPPVKNIECSVCFVCEKYIADNSEQDPRTLNRIMFRSLFSSLPDRIMKLVTCEPCYRKLLKVKSRFDKDNTVEEERDYWVFINCWRDQKGLENHVYSS